MRFVWNVFFTVGLLLTVSGTCAADTPLHNHYVLSALQCSSTDSDVVHPDRFLLRSSDLDTNFCHGYAEYMVHLAERQDFAEGEKLQLKKMIQSYANGYVPEQAYPTGRYFKQHRVYARHHLISCSNTFSDFTAIEQSPLPESERYFWAMISEWLVINCHVLFLADEDTAVVLSKIIRRLRNDRLIQPPYLEPDSLRGLMSNSLRELGIDIIATQQTSEKFSRPSVRTMDFRQALAEYPKTDFFLLLQPGCRTVQQLSLLNAHANSLNRPVLFLMISDELGIPDFIKRLQGSVKNLSSYRYITYENSVLKPWRGLKMQAWIFMVLPDTCSNHLCNTLKNDPAKLISSLRD